MRHSELIIIIHRHSRNISFVLIFCLDLRKLPYLTASPCTNIFLGYLYPHVHELQSSGLYYKSVAYLRRGYTQNGGIEYPHSCNDDNRIPAHQEKTHIRAEAARTWISFRQCFTFRESRRYDLKKASKECALRKQLGVFKLAGAALCVDINPEIT